MNEFSYGASSMSPKQLMTRSLSKMLTNNELVIENIKKRNEVFINQRIQNSLQLINVITVIVSESQLPEEIKENLDSLFIWFESVLKQVSETWKKDPEDTEANLRALEGPIKNIRRAFRDMPEN